MNRPSTPPSYARGPAGSHPENGHATRAATYSKYSRSGAPRFEMAKVLQPYVQRFWLILLLVAAGAGGSAIWAYRKPRVRSQFPIGVMGLGVLGRRVAQALASFDFPVNGWSRTLKSVPGVRCFGGDAGLAQFLAESRGLVCLLPLTAATRNILNHTTLSQLQRGGYVVNVARGAHVVDEDLIALVDSGHLAGATLDVFRTEPLPPEHAFWQHPRIVVTPHMSARTLHEESIAQIASKIIAMNQGQAVSGVVNREAGY